MKWMTVRICMVFLLLVSAGTIAQAQQSAFQGTWIGEEHRYGHRLEISGNNWSHYINNVIQGAGTARFSAGRAELLLADGTIRFNFTLLAPGLIEHPITARDGLYRFRISTSALMSQAREKHERGDYDGAIADYTEAIRLDPNNARTYNSRGWTYALKGDYDRAIADANASLRIRPNEAYTLHTRGYAYAGKGDYNRAIADFETALKINPNLAKETRDEIERDLSLAWQARGGGVVTADPDLVVNGNVVTGYRGKGGNIIIPYGITTIGDRAFINTGLISVTIPTSVTYIGTYAFSGCTGLTSVTFQGTIARGSDSFSNFSFPGDLASKYFAVGGGIGTYTRSKGSDTWTKQR